MTDPRVKTLAKNLVNFSCRVQKGENVLIETYGSCDDLLRCLIGEVYAAGGNPFVWRRDNEVQRAIAMGATEEQLKL
ncbi:MAG: aminopeptidase, partial [Clostridia bacterium]|nr:aminopeptidase [Clostridia bacterium]